MSGVTTLIIIAISMMIIAYWALRKKRQGRISSVISSLEKEITHNHEWELYHNELVPSQRIRVCLAELKISYKSHIIKVDSDLSSAAPNDTLGQLPRHQIPVLLHNGNAIYDSRKQMRYVIEQQSASGLMIPELKEEKSRLKEWLGKMSLLDKDQFQMVPGNEIFIISFPLFEATIEQVSFRKVLKTFLINRFSRKSISASALRAPTLASVIENSNLTDAFETAKEAIEAQLDEAENSLKEHRGPWVAGETFTQIDIEMMVLLDRLNLLTMLEDLFNSHRPNLKCYWEELKSRNSYKTAILAYLRPEVVAASLTILKTRAKNKDFDELLRVNH